MREYRTAKRFYLFNLLLLAIQILIDIIMFSSPHFFIFDSFDDILFTFCFLIFFLVLPLSINLFIFLKFKSNKIIFTDKSLIIKSLFKIKKIDYQAIKFFKKVRYYTGTSFRYRYPKFYEILPIIEQPFHYRLELKYKRNKKNEVFIKKDITQLASPEQIFREIKNKAPSEIKYAEEGYEDECEKGGGKLNGTKIF